MFFSLNYCIWSLLSLEMYQRATIEMSAVVSRLVDAHVFHLYGRGG